MWLRLTGLLNSSLVADSLNNMSIIKYRKIFYAISVLLVAASFYGLFTYGLKLGIDFTGGSNLQVEFSEAPDIAAMKEEISALGLGNFSLRPVGDRGIILRTRNLEESERLIVMQAVIGEASGAEVKEFDSVGPILGKELQSKALLSIIFVILAIVIFITITFRKVSKPVASWKYGVVAIIALVHDVIVPAGVFAFLGEFRGTEVDSLFVTALLVVLGFSVHDTIVVFDRTRENLRKDGDKKKFETIVGESVSQTFTRSINTSLTTIITLIVLYVVGPDATRDFSLALLIGITAGTYSSIFIGSPLLVTLQKIQDRKLK